MFAHGAEGGTGKGDPESSSMSASVLLMTDDAYHNRNSQNDMSPGIFGGVSSTGYQ